ncbi:hypothetical protein Tco_1098280, partial [Tanacetum coccineum]
KKYCTELLSEFGILACKPCSTPIKTNPEDKKLISKYGDEEALTVHCLSQVMHSPMKSQLRLAFRVLRYLKGEPGCGITFKGCDHNNLRVFVDSDWAKCKVTKRSITRYSVFLGNNLVSWKSKKQSVVSRSSTEAEFRAMCNVCCEIMWIKKILTDLQVDIDLPIEMNYDNNSATQISANPVLHERSKHFEIDLYFLREKIASGFIKPKKIKFEDNIADLFTKAEYYYDNLDLKGFGEEVSSKRNFHLVRKKYAGNMTLAERVSWVEEEANSSCFHTPQRHLGEVSKMIIDDNDDEHVYNNIVAKVDGNILVFNDNVGATEVIGDTMVGDNQVGVDNLVGVHIVVSPTNEEYVDVMGVIGAFENEIINGDDENELGEGGSETIILDVDIEVHNFLCG